jgi:dipeptidyl aminopeptidase/acylaminoacyl peptidase
MLVWVILPPNFDATKVSTLLYCKEDHKALDAILFFPLEFSMAANGYIVVAPNRRGMPGHGGWNEQISKDWGGQVMDDYLIDDDISKLC